MPKRKRGLTTEEIQKLLIDLEDEIFDDSDSDCELENEEDLDQSINFNVVAEDELISQEQNEIFWENPQIFHKAKILPFTGNIMIRGAAELCETESDFFNCIFKNSIVKKVTDETNIYAARILQNATPSNSRRHNPAWTQTNEVEMIKFLALILLMGHIEKDNVKEYWSTDPMLETPFFRTVMPRDRFLNLLRYLHFEDNNNIPDKTALDYDRLWKLRYVFDSLNNSFQNIYNPSEELAIDEVIVSFKGRVIFKQYIPKKRKRFGIKLYKVVDKKGYTFNMKVYLGCDKKRIKSDVKMTSTHATVLELAECVKDKGHKLFMDNFFSSPALFQQLYIEYKINSCGTMRPNRKNYPKKLACPKMKKGDLSVKFGCGMTAMCWKDKREVFMLSNMHDPDMSTSTLCNDRCEKPGLVTSYNTNMGFVDLSDRMANSYTFGRKTLKWTKKLFFHLLDLTVLNAFILYKIKTGNNICHKIFRLNLIRQLLQNENIETIITSPERNARNNRPENKHWPECKKVQRRCAMCKSKGMTRRTSVSCKLCNVGLCVNCFEEYHTN